MHKNKQSSLSRTTENLFFSNSRKYASLISNLKKADPCYGQYRRCLYQGWVTRKRGQGVEGADLSSPNFN